MGRFPFSFRSRVSSDPKLDSALAQNFEKAATEAYVVPRSIGDAKGDLIGFSAADTPVRIPAAAGDGYALTSDTTQTGGVAWNRRGSVAGYEQATSNKDATLNNATASSGLFTGFSVTGDSVHYLWLEFWCQDFRCTNGTGDMSLILRYGSTDIAYSNEYAASASNRATGAQYMKVRLDPFSGSRTFNIHSYNGNIGAGAVLRVYGAATSPSWLQATWGEVA